MNAPQRPLVWRVPFALVMIIVAIGLIRISLQHWREGSALIGGALLVAAGFRALLRNEQAGMLAIRGRGMDVLAYAGLGLMILFVALSIQGGPLSR